MLTPSPALCRGVFLVGWVKGGDLRHVYGYGYRRGVKAREAIYTGRLIN